MPSIDMSLEQMRQYRPSLYRQPDFESFWRKTVAESVDQSLNAELIPYNLPARGLQCYAVRFDGYKGGRLAGWYVRPDRAGRFPGVEQPLPAWRLIAFTVMSWSQTIWQLSRKPG